MATLISYEEFSKTEEYKAFAVVNPEQGSLKVMAFTADQAIPIEDAEIIITKEIGGNNVLSSLIVSKHHLLLHIS